MVEHIYEKKNYVAKTQKISCSCHKALAQSQNCVKLTHKNIVAAKQCFYDNSADILTIISEMTEGKFLFYF
jgi:hypothetical protein